MDPSDGQPDDSSIKPVSSLRSRFEDLASTKPTLPIPSSTTHGRPKSLMLRPSQEPFALPGTAPQSDHSKPSHETIAGETDPSELVRTKRRAPSPPKPRRPVSAIPHSPKLGTPQVNITSPKSPPKPITTPSHSLTRNESLTPNGLRSDTLHGQQTRHFRIPSRTEGTRSPVHGTPPLSALDAASCDPNQDSSSKRLNQGPKESRLPPPVNRKAKPIRGKEILDGPSESPKALAPHNQDRKVSPFSTPPSSNESSPHPVESPPPLPIHSKPKPVVKNISNDTIDKRYNSMEEDPPNLPPRRNVIPSRSHESIPQTTSKPSALTLGFSNKHVAGGPARVHENPHPGDSRNLTPPPRLSSDNRRVPPPPRNTTVIPGHDYDDRLHTTTDVPASNVSDYPDSSQSNRRLPRLSGIPHSISAGYEPRIFDMCGQYVCTSGYTTRVWDLLSGKLLLSIAHGETTKVTALCFTPARKIDLEGMRIWLGTNMGEILEIDIPSKRIVASESQVHNRYEIVKIHCRATEIWTLDSEGKLFLWPADKSGSPTLEHSVSNGRLGRRPTTSIVIGEELWVAFGKELKIYKPSSSIDNAQSVNLQSFIQQGAGDITSAGLLSDMVYFGHSDGKISIYSKSTYQFVELINASIYKITSLVGLGKYLWAGHATGMMYVYDTSTRPWKMKKDWRAHSGPVVKICADQGNIWKLDRLMVVSLGVDNSLCIWDGMLEHDWLEDDMREHNAEYCSFRNITSLVLTWNTGATTPTDLRYDEENSNFFRKLIIEKDHPDIIVFGLQELVDLEDKTLTAKTFFKSRHKDSYGQDHISSVYRTWRDYLSRCLYDAMPVNESYDLLHTASLVGLFSCIFVKSSEIGRVRDVQAVEIKTGMGGLHGNKGAIAIRCILDDSSLCFINCHLAAGQTKTMERNNDVAAILESSNLPPEGSSSGLFVGGGDGSMIMDSEICILNGDLNYRIDTMSKDTVISALKARNLPKLLDRDQLLVSRRKNPGFRLRAFQELPITFHPTYKYDVGTDTYDSSEKRRAPAWCDRILFRGPAQQLDYRRHEIRVSDHRPVSASFNLMVKGISRRKREECHQISMQRFAKFKESVSNDSKLEYLTNIFELTPQEAQSELSSIQEKRVL